MTNANHSNPKYAVVMFQGDDGSLIFGSDDFEECENFLKEQYEQFEGFVQNGFPEESMPDFDIVYLDSNGAYQFEGEGED